MSIMIALGVLIIAFFFCVMYLPHKAAAIIIAIASAIFLIYCSFPRGSGSADEGELFLYGNDTPSHSVNGLYNLKYSFSVEPIDPNQPYYLEFVLADSEEALYDIQRNFEYKIYSNDELTDSEVYVGEPEPVGTDPAKIKLGSWGWWHSNPVTVEYAVNGKKYHFPQSSFYSREETYCLFRGNNVHVMDLSFRYKDGYIVCFQNAIGAFFVNYIGPFAGSGILFLLILAGICAVGGLICGRRFGQGVLAGVMGLMLGQILMDLWIQIPVLRSGFMKPLYTSLTGLMNTIGSRFGMTAEFAPYTGVGGVILLIILMIIRLVILFYAVSMKRLYNFQTLLAFLVALVLQGVLYAPIYYLQSQFIWLALGLMVVFGAVLIFVGTGSGLFNMVVEGVGGSSSRKMEASDEWEIEEPQRSDLVYGSDGTQYTTGKDPFGHLVVFDDDNRQHLATERSDGSIIDDEDNEYW